MSFNFSRPAKIFETLMYYYTRQRIKGKDVHLPIEFENVPLTADADDARKTGCPWLRVTVGISGAEQLTMGDTPFHRQEGICFIQIFSKTNTGSQESKTRAGLIADYLKKSVKEGRIAIDPRRGVTLPPPKQVKELFLGLDLRSPYIAASSDQDDGWYLVLLHVPFQLDYREGLDDRVIS